MSLNTQNRHLAKVALRKESVDRNPKNPMISVDKIPSLSARRAWIEIIKKGRARRPGQSLSARRAWIEIALVVSVCDFSSVALRKESVDRNTQRRDFKRLDLLSLSARRAWIEIAAIRLAVLSYYRRSPQGERG